MDPISWSVYHTGPVSRDAVPPWEDKTDLLFILSIEVSPCGPSGLSCCALAHPPPPRPRPRHRHRPRAPTTHYPPVFVVRCTFAAPLVFFFSPCPWFDASSLSLCVCLPLSLLWAVFPLGQVGMKARLDVHAVTVWLDRFTDLLPPTSDMHHIVDGLREALVRHAAQRHPQPPPPYHSSTSVQVQPLFLSQHHVTSPPPKHTHTFTLPPGTPPKVQGAARALGLDGSPESAGGEDPWQSGAVKTPWWLPTSAALEAQRAALEAALSAKAAAELVEPPLKVVCSPSR